MAARERAALRQRREKHEQHLVVEVLARVHRDEELEPAPRRALPPAPLPMLREAANDVLERIVRLCRLSRQAQSCKAGAATCAVGALV